MYTIIGISTDYKLRGICSNDELNKALRIARRFAPEYLQLFIVRAGYNVQGLTWNPPEEGSFTVGKFDPDIVLSDYPV